MSTPGRPDERTQVRVLAAVAAYPGLHVRELARQLGMSVALVEYHLRALEREGIVQLAADQRFVRVFPAKGPRRVPPTDKAAVQALRNATGLQVVLLLLEGRDGVPHGDLAAQGGLAKSTLSFHLRKLEDAGIVTQRDGAYTVADAHRILRLLREYRPTPDLLDRFAALWKGLYG